MSKLFKLLPDILPNVIKDLIIDYITISKKECKFIYDQSCYNINLRENCFNAIHTSMHGLWIRPQRDDETIDYLIETNHLKYHLGLKQTKQIQDTFPTNEYQFEQMLKIIEERETDAIFSGHLTIACIQYRKTLSKLINLCKSEIRKIKHKVCHII